MAYRQRHMSSRDLPIIITDPAIADIADVFTFGIGEWGIEAAFAYREQIFASIGQLRIFPEIGRATLIHGQQVRVILIGQHRVIYQVQESQVRILRVTSQKARRPGRIDAADLV